MSLAVVNQFAKALLTVVNEPASTLAPEQALEQLDTVQMLIQSYPELRLALLSPAIDAKQKAKVIDRLGAMNGLHPIVRRFLNVVLAQRQLPHWSKIQQAFQAQLDEQACIVRAEVSAARELNREQQASLEAKLAGLMRGRNLRCRYAVDSALVGGVKVRMGSEVLDGSVRGQLDTLRRRLVAEA